MERTTENVTTIDPRIKRVFKDFKASYGHKYSSAYKTKEQVVIALHTWSKALGHHSDTAIFHAAHHCTTRLEWPPSLAEFTKLVNDYKRNESKYDHIEKMKEDEKNVASPEVAESHLAKAKQLARRKTNESN